MAPLITYSKIRRHYWALPNFMSNLKTKQKLHNLKNYYRLASNSPSGPVSVLLTETSNIVTYKPQN